MSETGGAAPQNPAHLQTEEVLHAKYLDYCSAQIADILLYLSPDEIYVLAQDAAGEAGIAGDLSYAQIVSMATRKVSEKMALPPFDVWVEDYLEHPEHYERYLMGLWETEEQE